MKRIHLLIFTLLLFILPVSTWAAPLDEVKDYVSEYYVGDLTGDLDTAATIEDVISLLDPYSDYFTADELKQFSDSVNMTNIGIGVLIEQHDKGIYISEVFNGGSAEQAGLVAGDIITHVDDIPLEGLDAFDASTKILGAENTQVKITFINQAGESQTVVLIRKMFSLPNITAQLLYGNIGYISLSSFSEDAVKLVRNEIVNLTTQGATSFIFDLRNNTGGYVTSAEQIIGLFPGARNAYSYIDSTGTYLVPAQRQGVQFPKNTIVLMNSMSASASEMTVAALQDQQISLLYGETTYGKGTMQAFLPVSGGGYLKLTIAEFFGPKGTKIKDIGISPNVTTNNALAKAHTDLLTAKFANYNVTKPLVGVSTTKTFTITLNKAVTNIDENSIELVTVGGKAVPTTIQASANTISVSPVKPLQSGAEYMLIIHPTLKGQKAALKKGSYTHITVK